MPLFILSWFFRRCSPDVILALGDQLQDTKPEVRAAAMETFDVVRCCIFPVCDMRWNVLFAGAQTRGGVKENFFSTEINFKRDKE